MSTPGGTRRCIACNGAGSTPLFRPRQSVMMVLREQRLTGHSNEPYVKRYDRVCPRCDGAGFEIAPYKTEAEVWSRFPRPAAPEPPAPNPSSEES